MNVGSELDQDRPTLAMDAFQRLALAHQPCQQRRETVRCLKVTQTRRVRRGDVNGKIVGDIVKHTQARRVIRHRIGAVLIRSNIYADDTAWTFGKTCPRPLMSTAIEAEPVDRGVLADQAEHARAWIAGLRARRHRADLSEAEAHGE